MDYSYPSLAVLVFVSFISTNLDNLVLLTLLLNSQRQSRRFVSLGYGVACAVVLCLSLGIAMAGSELDGRLAGYLGVVPILLGITMLLARYRRGGQPDEKQRNLVFSSGMHVLFGTAAIMLGNSGDSFALFLPLFVDTQASYYLFASLCFVLIAVIWVFLANKVAASADHSERVIRFGELLAPYLMIGVGIYIFLDTAADRVL